MNNCAISSMADIIDNILTDILAEIVAREPQGIPPIHEIYDIYELVSRHLTAIEKLAYQLISRVTVYENAIKPLTDNDLIIIPPNIGVKEYSMIVFLYESFYLGPHWDILQKVSADGIVNWDNLYYQGLVTNGIRDAQNYTIEDNTVEEAYNMLYIIYASIDEVIDNWDYPCTCLCDREDYPEYFQNLRNDSICTVGRLFSALMRIVIVFNIPKCHYEGVLNKYLQKEILRINKHDDYVRSNCLGYMWKDTIYNLRSVCDGEEHCPNSSQKAIKTYHIATYADFVEYTLEALYKKVIRPVELRLSILPLEVSEYLCNKWGKNQPKWVDLE